MQKHFPICLVHYFFSSLLHLVCTVLCLASQRSFGNNCKGSVSLVVQSSIYLNYTDSFRGLMCCFECATSVLDDVK